MEMIQGGREKGYCAVANCEHAEMELLHQCDTCKRYVHVLCMMAKDLLVSEEKDPAITNTVLFCAKDS